MAKKKDNKIIGLILVLLVLGAIGYFFFSPGTPKGEIPPYVTGEMREIYEWAKVSPGRELLEQIPCYCGCKYEGHTHTRHCYWKDNGDFDKHGITCSVCFDIATKTKERYEQGKSICEIRKEIDDFYEPNKDLATETPMPDDC